MSDWNAYLDPATGNTYYANAATGVTTWEIPDEYREYLAAGAPPPVDPDPVPTESAIAVDPAPPAVEGFQPPAPDNWMKHIDPSSGNPYYHNTSTGETRWEPPPGFLEEAPPPPFPSASGSSPSMPPEGQPDPPPPTITLETPWNGPDTYDRVLDPNTMRYYYVHKATQQVQWEEPESEPLSAQSDQPLGGTAPLADSLPSAYAASGYPSSVDLLASPPPATKEQAVARARAKFEAAVVPGPPQVSKPQFAHIRTKSHHELISDLQSHAVQDAAPAKPPPSVGKLNINELPLALSKIHLGPAPNKGPSPQPLDNNAVDDPARAGARSGSIFAASAAISLIAGRPAGFPVEQKGAAPPAVLNRGKSASIINAPKFSSLPGPLSPRHPKLPAPICLDIAKFQIEGFAENHFREVKTRRGLTKQKVPMEQIIRFQKEPITQCLLASVKEHNTPAVDNFRRILQCMGDLPASKPPTHYAKEIVHVALKKAYLRDEIFCQVCKQCTENPVASSLTRGWKLMAILCSAFAPTLAFQDFLMAFIAKNFEGPHDVAYLAPFCFWRLEKTIKLGGEATHYTMEQLDHWLEHGVPSTMVLFGGSIEYIMSLQGAEGHQDTVPVLLTRLVKIIKDGGGLQTKGMFRLAGDRGETVQFKEHVENSRGYEFKCPNIHVAGDLLKIWLRDLSEPLIPGKFYDECLAIGGDRKRVVDFCHQNLPATHLAVVDYLMKFFHEIIANEKENSMNSENLAIVFCTNMLRRRQADQDPSAMLKNSNREKAFVKTLIEAWGS